MPALQPGGRRQPGSGNGEGASRKGDSRGDLFLVSAKTTAGAGIRVERGWLTSAAQQARNVRLLPALVFGFDGAGSGRLDWMAFEMVTAKVMIDVIDAVRRGDSEAAEAAVGLLGT